MNADDRLAQDDANIRYATWSYNAPFSDVTPYENEVLSVLTIFAFIHVITSF